MDCPPREARPADLTLAEGQPLPARWRLAFGGATGCGVRIGVVDSGWDVRRCVPNVEAGIGWVDPEDELRLKKSEDYADTNGHGTLCTQIIVNQAPEARILPIRVFGRALETSVPLLVAGLKWAVDQRIPLVNMSLGTLREDARDPLYRICEHARRQGTVVVAAINGSTAWSYPAVFDNVISVGMGTFPNPLHYTYAPGEVVECRACGQTFIDDASGPPRTVSGTSFAAPHITGIIALLLEHYPKATLPEVRALLRAHALNTPSFVP